MHSLDDTQLRSDPRLAQHLAWARTTYHAEPDGYVSRRDLDRHAAANIAPPTQDSYGEPVGGDSATIRSALARLAVELVHESATVVLDDHGALIGWRGITTR